MRRTALALSALALCLSLTACKPRPAGGDAPAAGNGADATLPAPANAGGSITGMPAPGAAGPRSVDPVAASASAPSTMPPPVDPEPMDGAPVTVEPAPPGNPAPGLADEATPDAAVAALRDYYAAINDRDYGRAYALWSPGANPQSQAQFADGFGDTLGVSVDIGAPGRIEGAAGSRYVDIPVTLSASQRDGSTRRYAGRYSLRAVMGDGATAEQRRWHIAGASIHELH